MKINDKMAILLMLMLGLFLFFSIHAVAAADSFVSVQDIIDVPATVPPGAPLTLSGTVLPADATHKDIKWTVKDAGATGATITDGVFNASVAGTATVTATIENGLAGDNIAVIAAGNLHSMAIKKDGSLWAWGYNAFGQLGNGVNTNSPVPIRVGADNDWAAVAPALYHTAALKTDGSLWTWGFNIYGQLGNGTAQQSLSPIHVGTADDWAALAAGNSHTLAIKTDGSLWAWGLNGNGQLGDGTTVNRNVPVRVGAENNWAKLAAGGNFVLAIKTDGSLWAWGQNSFGQLGDNATADRHIPARIGTDTDWTGIAAGTYHSIALKTDGSLWVWGGNASGQLGDGTNINRLAPIRIGTATDWTTLAAGGTHSMAIKADGSLWSWGDNASGQLGAGNTISRNTPAQVGEENSWAAIAAGDNHSMGLKKDTSLWDWGASNYGQVGDGATTERDTPVLIRVGTSFIKDFIITVGDALNYTVTFVDWDDTVLKTETVAKGASATAPANPERIGYLFKGWDKDFSNITANLTVKALYDYNANYNFFVYVESAQTEVKAGDTFYLNVMLAGNLNYTQVNAMIKYDSNVFEYKNHVQLANIASQVNQVDATNLTVRSAPSVSMFTGAPCLPPVMVAQLEFKVKNNLPISSVSADFTVHTAAVYPTALIGIAGIKIGPGNTITIDLK